MVDRNLRSSDQRNVQVPGSVCLFFRKKGSILGADWKSLGNIVSAEFDAVIEKLDHFSVRRGLRAKDKTVITERNASMNFVFDEINRHNLEFAFGSAIDSVAAVAELRTKHEGIFNAVGAAPQTIDIGVLAGDILSLIVRDPFIEGAPVTYVTPADYTFDAPTGVITTVAAGALDPMPANGDVHVFIEKVVGTEKHEIHEGTEIEGEAQFQVFTPGGAQFAVVFPNVVMRNNGAIAIGDGTAWMEIQMTLEILVDVLGSLGKVHVINEVDTF